MTSTTVRSIHSITDNCHSKLRSRVSGGISKAARAEMDLCPCHSSAQLGARPHGALVVEPDPCVAGSTIPHCIPVTLHGLWTACASANENLCGEKEPSGSADRVMRSGRPSRRLQIGNPRIIPARPPNQLGERCARSQRRGASPDKEPHSPEHPGQMQQVADPWRSPVPRQGPGQSLEFSLSESSLLESATNPRD
jgi:hypothetical protein